MESLAQADLSDMVIPCLRMGWDGVESSKPWPFRTLATEKSSQAFPALQPPDYGQSVCGGAASNGLSEFCVC